MFIDSEWCAKFGQMSNTAKFGRPLSALKETYYYDDWAISGGALNRLKCDAAVRETQTNVRFSKVQNC